MTLGESALQVYKRGNAIRRESNELAMKYRRRELELSESHE